MIKEAIYIGWDPRQIAAYAVARYTLRRALTRAIPIMPLILDRLREAELYRRDVVMGQEGQLWDPISLAPMSTEFAISRFLVPHLMKSGWALYMDCDVLIRHNVSPLFYLMDESKAVYVVKHNYIPPGAKKMDGREQWVYGRKNWSSVMLFNCDHPANRALTLEMINTRPGRDLHQFCWLKDEDIGEISPEWNYLVGHTKDVPDPTIVHFTEGGPWLPKYADCEYADEWWNRLKEWSS